MSDQPRPGQTILVPGAFIAGSAQHGGGRDQWDFELVDNIDYRALENTEGPIRWTG